MKPFAWELAQRLCAACALLALSPVLVLVAILIRLESAGPALFRQQRRGLGGHPFTIFKFRTLSQGSETQTALGVRSGDSQVTRLGRVLRDLKLDELPQLFNVARGDMSFVGPRPLPLALEDRLLKEIPGFARRWQARPGLTNAAQVSLVDNRLGEDLVADWSERFTAELHLLRHRGPAYDTILVGLTACFLARRVCSKLASIVARYFGPGEAAPAETTQILGIPVANANYAETIQKVAGWVSAQESRMVCVTPVHSLVDAWRLPAHRAALLASDHNTADGVPVVWAQRLLGYRGATRVYGPDLTLKLLERAALEGWRVAFHGGHQDRLPVLLARLIERFPSLDVVYAHSPPFGPLSESHQSHLESELRRTRPDLVFVGLGAPKQELLMSRLRGRVPGVLLGVGAAFDFHAGAVSQAPGWIQGLGLEWAFRLAMEPRRLFVRYARSNPLYVIAISVQLVAHYLLGKSYQASTAAQQVTRFPPLPLAATLRLRSSRRRRVSRTNRHYRASARSRASTRTFPRTRAFSRSDLSE